MSAKRIVLVGHCGPDVRMLTTAISRIERDTPIISVNDAGSLARAATAGHVLLVNRVLDGAFDTTSGIELIERLGGGGETPVMMLISNLAEAQTRAEQAGAMPGFGKSELYQPRTAERVRAAVACAAEGGSHDRDPSRSGRHSSGRDSTLHP